MGVSFVKLEIISYFLITVLLVERGASQDAYEECKVARCGEKGPPIRFPFRLKGRQPPHCGYPGFELSCTHSNQTMLELPNLRLKLHLREIYYVLQRMKAYNPYCIPKKNLKFLNLSTSPFQFYRSSMILKCSINHTKGPSIPCLSDSKYIARAIDYDSITSSNTMWGVMVSCSKLFHNLPVPSAIFQSKLPVTLGWSTLEIFQPHSDNETECCNETKKGGHGLKFSLVTAGFTTGSFVIVLGFLATFYVYHIEKQKRENGLRIEKFLEDYIALKPSRYTYADVKNITNDFEDKLGEGAYGIVFKGKLSNDVLVAVKILNNIEKGNGEEFINEVATIGQIHHVNVVRLVGYCADGFRRALVYEFLPNDSLEKYISIRRSTGTENCSLSWEKLFDIALGTAKGIEYLHQDCDKRIIHFDIKPKTSC